MAASYKRPGAFIEETLLPQQIPSLNLDVAVGAFLGAAERGPSDTPIFVSSWAEFVRTFGSFKKSDGTEFPLAYQVYMFFANSGRGCWVKRVTSSEAERASVVLSDKNVTVGGADAALDVLRLVAASPGDWALADSATRGVSVSVDDQTPRFIIETAVRADNVLAIATSSQHGLAVGDAVRIVGLSNVTMTLEGRIASVPSAYTFTIANTGTAATVGTAGVPTNGRVIPAEGRFSLAVLSGGTTAGYFVEKFNDLSMNPSSERYAPRVINLSSRYITAELPLGFTPNQVEGVDIYRAPGTTAVPVGLGRSIYTQATSTLVITAADNDDLTSTATITVGTHTFLVNDRVSIQGVVVDSSLENIFNGTHTITAKAAATVSFASSADLGEAVVTLGEGSTASVTTVTASTVTGSLDGNPLTAEELIAQTDQLDPLTPNLVVNVPDAPLLGQTGCRRVYSAFLAKVDERADSFLVMDTPPGLLPAEAAGFASDITPKSANGAIYYPNVRITDPGSTGSVSVVKTLPPGGSVVGLYLNTDASRGSWKAPAGVGAALKNVVSLERALSSSELDALNTAVTPVNAIRPIPGSGNCVMGARTISQENRFRYVSTRRSMLQIKKKLIDLTTFAIFENNDPNLWASLRTVISVYLQEVWQQGGLRGDVPAQAFYVTCDGSNNTNQTIADGQVNIEVGVALQTPAEFVVIKIGQFEGGASATVQE